MVTARWLRLTTALALLVGAYALAPTAAEAHLGAVARLGTALLLVAGATAVMIRQLRLSVHDDERKIDGLVLAVVTVTLVFALLFYLLDARRPDEVVGLETRLDALYFTLTTMLTIGYGDVHAAGQAARALVVVQMVFDIVFVAAAATVLSSRVRRAAASRRPRGDGTSGA